MGKKNIGSSFDNLLAEDAMLEEVTAVALKRVIAWQIAEEMKAQHLTKTELAKRMHTSRAALNRLLDEEDSSLTLTTLARSRLQEIRTINPQETFVVSAARRQVSEWSGRTGRPLAEYSSASAVIGVVLYQRQQWAGQRSSGREPVRMTGWHARLAST